MSPRETPHRRDSSDSLPLLRPLFTWMCTCLVFFAFPFLITCLGFGRSWEREEAEILETAFQEMDSHLLHLRKREDSRSYLGELLNALSSRIDREKNPETIRQLLRKGISALRRRFPGILRIIVTDKDGSVIPEFSDPAPGKTLIKKLHSALLACRNEKLRDIKPLKDGWPAFQSFIGPTALLDRMYKNSGSLYEVQPAESKHFFFYRIRKRFGFLVHANRPADWPFLALRDQAHLYQAFRKNPSIKLGIEMFTPDPTRTTTANSGRFPPSDPALTQVLAQFQQNNQSHLVAQGRAFSLMTVAPDVRLWASRSMLTLSTRNQARGWLVTIGTILFGALAMISYRTIVLGGTFTLPIKVRLILLFGFASGVPISLVIFAQWDYLAQLSKTRVREYNDDCERSLFAFDGRFTSLRSRIERDYSRFLKPCGYDKPRGQRRTQRIMDRLMDWFKASEVFLIARNGKMTYEANSRDKTNPHPNKRNASLHFVGELVRGVGNILDHESVGSLVNPTELFASSVFGGDNMLSDMARDLGKLLTLAAGHDSKWFSMIPLYNNEKKITHMVTSLWDRFQLERFYIESDLRTAERNLPHTRLVAVCPTRNDSPVPEDLTNLPRLGEFIKSLVLKQGTIFGRGNGPGGRGYLLTGIKGKELTEHYLIAIRSEKPILEEIALLQKRMWFFASMLAAISLYLGMVLAQRFLTPIKYLSLGVTAIAQRQFKYRLPGFDPDELGQLAAVFNRVMEGLADLEVGRIVQESLLPIGGLETGPYRLYGLNHAATELGGDYFEIKAFPDGRVLVLIGDVAGHGVPAALVMAMAKGMVESRLSRDFSLENLVVDLNQVILETMKRKRMMTCIFAVLDPLEHTLSVVNAGHNFPYLFPADERRHVFEQHIYPLGGRKNIEVKTNKIPLKPGDRILFYTDGLIETMTDQCELGYERVGAALPSLIDDDPKASCERIYDWTRSLCISERQEDDITLVMLIYTDEKTSRGEG